MKIIETLKAGVKYLLETPDTNSRFVFLLHGVAASVGLVVLVVAFTLSPTKGEYPSMVMALSGGGAAAAIGRAATNYASSLKAKKEEKEEEKDNDAS